MKVTFLSCLILLMMLLVGCTSLNNNSCGGINCNNPECSIHYIKTAGTGDQIAIQVEILNDRENGLWAWLWGTKAELYLKLSVADLPGIYWLYPLNIEHKAAGNRTISYKTPFFISKNRQTNITVELLDNDKLSEDEVNLLADAVKTGGMLLCDGVNFYARKYTKEELVSAQNKKAITELLKTAAVVAVKEMRPFDSMGHREYIPVNTGSLFVSNPMTIIDSNGRARCDVRFHLVP